MFNTIQQLITQWRQWRAFTKLPETQRRLVVYSEGAHDWPHIGPMLEEFIERYPDEFVSYVSSDTKDPGLSWRHANVRSFYIGSGSVRTLFFQFLRCRMLLLSLPDIENLYLKRSQVFPVHYVYCFHSINSAHTVYRAQAFAHYDTILCVGPHQHKELRREEELGLAKRRQLLAHGSVKLDSVISRYAHIKDESQARETPLILLAPSWGDGSFAENPTLIREMLRQILSQPWHCSLRLHPMTQRRCQKEIAALKALFYQEIATGALRIEDDLNDNSSLRDAAIMVSDWSGAATEFAFGLERPVLFINTPQKINNPSWTAYEMLGLEDSIRSQIGTVLQPEHTDNIVPTIEGLIQNKDAFVERIRHARETWIYNPNASAQIGAQHLKDLLDNDGVADSDFTLG